MAIFQTARPHADKVCRFTHTLVYLCRAQSHVLGAEGDIGIHRLLKKLILRVLEHKSNLVADILSRDFVGVYILAVDRDRAGGRLQQSVQVLDKCRLTRARVTDKSHELAVRYLNIYVVYCDLFKGRARTVNMAQAAHLNI